MRALRHLAGVLRAWLRPGRLDRDLREELRFHIERETEANLAAGMTPAEAARAARLALGGVEQIEETTRVDRPGARARAFARDVRYGARLLRKAPGFAGAGIAIVALGMAAVTAMFTIVYGVVLRPLPFHEPERLVNLWTRTPRYGLERTQVNVADANEWRAGQHVFTDIALTRNIASFNLTGSGEPERLQGARVAANLFPLLGVTAAFGRTFTEDEDETGQDRVVLLSDGLWRRRFAADPGIVGRSIVLNGYAHLVVGVMRPDFRYPSREFQMWTPLTFNPRQVSREEPGYDHSAIARLAPGVSLEQARREMDVVAKRLQVAHPVSNRDIGIEVASMQGDLAHPIRTALYALLAAVTCLLLLASLNLSNLLSVRGAARQREYAVRLALGASRGRLVLQAFAETAPILLLGGVLGVLLAEWAVRAFVPLAPASLPRVESLTVNLPVLAVSALVLVSTGLLAGLSPAAYAWRSDLAAVSPGDARWSTGGRRESRAQRLLVVAQLALALPLMIGAGLLVRSFTTLTAIEPGFQSEGVMTMHLAIPRSKYGSDARVAAFCDRLIERVRGVPGVASVGMVNRLPLAGIAQIGTLELESGAAEPVKLRSVDWRTATPDYFRAMGIPLVEGRLFTEADAASATPVGIIDESIALAAWPGQSAIGRRYRIPPELVRLQQLFAWANSWITVIGVVGHIRHDSLDDEGRPQVYWSHWLRAQDRMVLAVRTTLDPSALASPVIAAIRDVDPEQAVYDVRPMRAVVERTLAQRWLNTALLTAFAVAALLLSSIGLYGVIAFGVARRTRELGIRLALGADRRAVTQRIVVEGGRLALAGIALGLAISLPLAQGLRVLRYGVPATDPISFAAAAILLAIVALAASYVPARRAAAIDPATTLRAE